MIDGVMYTAGTGCASCSTSCNTKYNGNNYII